MNYLYNPYRRRLNKRDKEPELRTMNNKVTGED
jgi:hypothetical protein